MVFLNNKEEEIDRIVGYLPPDAFLKELQRIKEGTDTYLSLLNSVEENDKDAGSLAKFADKLMDMGQSEVALTNWYKLKDLNDPEYNQLAEFKIVSMEGNRDSNPVKILEFLKENKGSEYYLDALTSGMRILNKTGNKEEEARLYQEYIAIQEKNGNLSYSMLNGYAWRMTELELNLEDALKKAVKAVELSADNDPETQAQVLDTLAEVYWKLGEIELAVDAINKAIALNPEDNYYKDQLKKFQG